MHQGADFPSFNQSGEIPLCVHVKHNDRHVAFAAQRKGCLVHDLEVVFKGLVKGKILIFDGGRVFLRICGINAVDPRAFQKGIRSDFKSPERST